MDEMTDWTSAEVVAHLTTEELHMALERMGVNTMGCYVGDDVQVNVAFQDIQDAATMVSLGVQSDATPGTLYDRATASCVTLSSFANGDVPPTESERKAAVDAGWKWTVHPFMIGRRMDWHVSVEMSVPDASQLAANLNALFRGRS